MVLVIVNLASLVFLVLFKPVPLVVQEMEFVYLLEIKWLVYVILDSQVMTVLKKLVQMIAQEMEIVLTEFVLVTMDGVVMIVDLVALEWVKIVMEMENVSPVHAIVILVGLVMVVKIKTCLYDCSQHGYCNNGTCFCQQGFRGTDCSLSAEPQPCQCAIHCVRTCLKQCNDVYVAQGPGPSHKCYGKCTQQCVPICMAGKMPSNTDDTLPF